MLFLPLRYLRHYAIISCAFSLFSFRLFRHFLSALIFRHCRHAIMLIIDVIDISLFHFAFIDYFATSPF
jgi:hypothetical protein